jgi:pilus assembly protein Flp/PilA
LGHRAVRISEKLDRSPCVKSLLSNKNFELLLRPDITHEASDRKSSSWEFVMRKAVWDFLSDEHGATAIEYGLIAAGIALAIIAVVNGLGTSLNSKYAGINTSLK